MSIHALIGAVLDSLVDEATKAMNDGSLKMMECVYKKMSKHQQDMVDTGNKQGKKKIDRALLELHVKLARERARLKGSVRSG